MNSARIRPTVADLAKDVDALAERLLFALQEPYAHGIVIISTDTARALLHLILKDRDGEVD